MGNGNRKIEGRSRVMMKSGEMYTYTDAQFDSESHERPARAHSRPVSLAQEEVECHQVLLREEEEGPAEQ